jgi:hypothetical protein
MVQSLHFTITIKQSNGLMGHQEMIQKSNKQCLLHNETTQFTTTCSIGNNRYTRTKQRNENLSIKNHFNPSHIHIKSSHSITYISKQSQKFHKVLRLYTNCSHNKIYGLPHKQTQRDPIYNLAPFYWFLTKCEKIQRKTVLQFATQFQ